MVLEDEEKCEIVVNLTDSQWIISSWALTTFIFLSKISEFQVLVQADFWWELQITQPVAFLQWEF